MPQFSKEDIERIMDSLMEPEDTFTFKCKMCGDCCRNRRENHEQILLTGLDIFRIAQALEMTPHDVIAKHTEGYLGDNTHMPVLVLKERLDGSCSLLRKGHCMVHRNKPVVCAIYPLGRMALADGDKGIRYFNQEHICSKGLSGEIQEWTLKAWLEEFGIDKLESQSQAWNRLLTGIAREMCKLDKDAIKPLMIEVMAAAMYLSYDTSMSYEDCVEANIHMISKIFKEVFNIDLKFEE